jgi:hypothetical protein
MVIQKATILLFHIRGEQNKKQLRAERVYDPGSITSA